MSEEVQVRLDKYLWAIRIFKTRGEAKKAIENGKVRMNDEPAKPSKIVNRGDVYKIRAENRRWTIKVLHPLAQRKKFAEAQNYYEDITPEVDKEMNVAKQKSAFYTGKRLSRTGKPSKRERRNLDDFLEEM